MAKLSVKNSCRVRLSIPKPKNLIRYDFLMLPTPENAGTLIIVNE